MKLHQWSPNDLVSRDAHLLSVIPRAPSGLADPTMAEGYVSATEAFKANWERENLTAYLYNKYGTSPDVPDNLPDQPFERGTAWSPYTYVHQNWDEKRRQEFDVEIRQGFFDDVTDAADLEARAYHLAQEKDLVRRAHNGSGFASFVGALAGAATDLTSYIPLAAPINRLRGLGRVGKGAALGFSAAALPELGLQAAQDLRTAEETFMALGVGTILGGGLGTFARFLDARRPMNPAHPDNPLHPDNMDKQTVGYRTGGIDGQTEILDGRSVGAMEVAPDRVEALPGMTSNIPGLKWASRKVDGATPAGRSLRWAGTHTRNTLTRMMDLGGRMTNRDMAGVAVQTAESLKRDYMAAHTQLLNHGEFLIRDLNLKLGQSKVAQTFGKDGSVSHADFNHFTNLKLLREWVKEDAEALAKKYGRETAEIIEQTADRFASKIHETNALYESELVSAGLLQDAGLVIKISKDLDTVRNRIKQRQAQKPTVGDLRGTAQERADQRATLDPARQEADAEIAELRAERQRLEDRLSKEMGKPKAMGEEYGHAQLYDPSRILADTEGFKDDLMRVLVDQPDQDWLLADQGITPDIFSKLGLEPVELDGVTLTTAEGAARKEQLMQLWMGDQDAHRLHTAELRHETAVRADKQAKEDLTWVMKAAGLIDRKSASATVSEARKKRDLFAAQIDEQRARAEELRLEQEALKAAAEASRTITLERQLQDNITPTRATEGSLASQIMPDAPEPRETPAMARTAARAQTLARELHKAESRLVRMEARLEAADAAFARVSEKATMLKSAKAGADGALRDIRRLRGIAEADLSAAKRKLLQQQRKTPLSEAVDAITMALINREALPRPMLDKIVPEIGRVKARRINYTPEQRRMMEEKGYLRKDLPAILQAQNESLSGYIALHKGLDIGDGRTYESWTAIREGVVEEYTDLINKAGKDTPEGVALRAELPKALKDVDGLKNRLLGTENVGMDKDGWVYWLSSQVRQTNLVRYMAGFLLPSLTDIASVHLRTGSLSRLFREHGREAAKILREVYTDNPSLFSAMISSVELGADPRLAKAFDADDVGKQAGIGAHGSTKHKITSAIDRGGATLAKVGGVISGMHHWNRYLKAVTGIYRANYLRHATTNWAGLSDIERADLTSLGIGKSQADRIGKYVERYGEVGADGHWDPRLEQWLTTDEGFEAARDFRMAIERDMDRAIFTPGIGDTPLIMSHGAGKMWLQFQTFAFTFLNRFLVPAGQRLTAGDTRALVSYAHLTWSALVVVMGKDLIRGKDPRERLEEDNWGDTAFEMVDRSGVMTYLSPYVDAGIKLSAPLQEAALGKVVVGSGSRYARNSALDSLAGASFGLYRDIRDMSSAVAGGEMEKIGDKALLLMPFNTYSRLFMNQLEVINK